MGFGDGSLTAVFASVSSVLALLRRRATAEAVRATRRADAT
jgi:hypothetical protein